MNILVSACLTGLNCKYNGKNNLNKKVERLLDKHTVISVCPEQLGGLPTPRPAAEISNGKVINKCGDDVTREFNIGAEKTLEIARKYNCNIAVFKANSPSCGCGFVYDGTFSGNLVSGDGICTRLLKENGIRVITEIDLPE